MIWCDNRFWPLAGRSLHFTNTILVSPHTGEVWARIDRGLAEWLPMRMAAAGERPWPLPENIPGSLFLDYDETRWLAINELPPPLVKREIALIERWTSGSVPLYNSATNHETEVSVSPTLMQEIALYRAKELAGDITDEERRMILRKLREGRVTAAKTSAASRAKSVKVDPDAALADFLS